MIRFNPLNPRTQCQMVRGFNGLKRIIADRVSLEIFSFLLCAFCLFVFFVVNLFSFWLRFRRAVLSVVLFNV